MQKALSDFLFGVCFGMGFAVAAGICHIIAAVLVNAH